MKLYYGTGRPMLEVLETQGVKAPSSWTPDYEEAYLNAAGWGTNRVVLEVNSEKHEFSPDSSGGLVCAEPVNDWAFATNPKIFLRDRSDKGMGINSSDIKETEIRNFVIHSVQQTAPEGATDFTYDGFKVTYYRRCKAFNMNLLEAFNGTDWKMCSYLPWGDLKPLTESKKPKSASPSM